MAEAAILAALKVIGDIMLASELVRLAISQTFPDLRASINNISQELGVMKGFLNEIDDEISQSHTAWVKEVQNSANKIEDIVSEFAYIVGSKKFHRKKFLRKLFYVRTTAKNPKALKRIASELSEVEKSLRNLADIKDRWVTERTNMIRRNLEYSNEYIIDEDKIVGIEQNRQVITNWVICEKPQLSVISVWGMGGVGKTTLITNVFKRLRKTFDYHAWVSISQSYTIENILRNIIFEMCKHERKHEHNDRIDTTNMDLRGMKKNLAKLLKDKKYFIVLDDMWDPNAFRNISDTFIDNHQGSRIVITSRIALVANLAPECNRLELKPLSENESWYLFCIKAFHFEKNYECPTPLEKCAKKIVSKCDGLPLALVSLGGVLSLYDNTKSEWKRIYDQLGCELDNNPSLGPLKNIIMLSFQYLPRYLKDCFLYCGLFPENFLFTRKKLLRFWVAEGFIEEKGSSTLEEVAEGYLLELIHCSMFQVVKRNSSGRVKRCRMHDTLREVANCLSRKENFEWLKKNSRIVNFNNSTRRLSIVKLKEEISHDVCFPHLRTFMSFVPEVPSSLWITLILDKSKYLAVLNLEGQLIETIPDAILKLFNLRYLGLRGTQVKLLPKSIEKLNNLQTLDLMDSQIQELPDGIVELKKLRHLFAQVRIDPTHRTFRALTGISLPKGIFYLKELQTLQALESNAIIVRELENLTQLRSFRVLNVKENHSADLCRSIAKISSLSCLSIYASNENYQLQLEGLKFQPQLQKLTLFGRLKEQIHISGEGIQMLRLGWSQVQEDPLPSLSHLKNLTLLKLQKAYNGTKLNFKAEWFPKLKYLSLRQMPNLVQVELEQDTMVILEKIKLQELEQLVEIPKGIEHLINLKCMVCKHMPADFVKLASEIQQQFPFKCDVDQPKAGIS